MTFKPYIRSHHLIVWGVFVLFFSIGIFIADDYGLPYDDPEVRSYGVQNLNYVLNSDPEIFEHRSKYHGPAFELVLALAEKILHLTDSRQIYVMRHRLTFLLFYAGVWSFYLLCQYRFKNWKISLLGSLFLIVSPRIFAHAFYNSRDLAFLAVCIIGMYAFVQYLERKTLMRV